MGGNTTNTNIMSRSFTITQEGFTREFTVSTGVGSSGASAYQVALDNGFVGTEQEWLDSLQGSDANVTNANVNLAIETDPAATRGSLGLGSAALGDFPSPPPIGDVVPNSGAFTTLSVTEILTAPRITGRCDGLEVFCKAGLAINAGQVVYVTGASGNNIIIGLAQANAEPTSSKTIGISESTLANNATGYAITEGLMTVSISAPAANEGDSIWLSPTTAGGMVFGLANKPIAPNHIVYLGVVTRKTGNTVVEIYVKIQNGAELDELADVLITSPTEGQALMRGATLWENRSLAAADISDLGTAAYADTGTAEGQVAIFGEQGSFSTNGNNATISTTGSDAYIFTSGEGASISTSGTSAFILTRDTFKLFNGANTTTLDHSATAEQTITLPDASGTIALTSDITGTNSGTNTGDETTSTIGTLINGAATNSSPIDTDEFGTTNSASLTLKKLTFANLKATLKTYLDTLYVALTGNQTIAGDKTFSGQTELTGQAATNGTSAMSRELLPYEASMNLFEPIGFSAPTKSGTTFTTQAPYGMASFYLQVSGGATVGAFARVESVFEQWARQGSGASMSFLYGEHTIIFDLYVNAFGSNEVRVLWGTSAGKTVLDVAGWGWVFTSVSSCKLQVHNGATLTESSPITLQAPLGIGYYHRFMLTASNGTLKLYQRYANSTTKLGRWVALGNIIGTSLSNYSSGNVLSFVNITNDTAPNSSTLSIKNPVYYQGVIAP